MALGCQIVDFIRLHGLDDADELTGIRHVPVVEVNQTVFLHVPHPFVQVKVFDAARVEGGGPAQDPFRSVLPADTPYTSMPFLKVPTNSFFEPGG